MSPWPLGMNLDELRLRALLSLKKGPPQIISTVTAADSVKENEKSNGAEELDENRELEEQKLRTVEDSEREEGEISDYEEPEEHRENSDDDKDDFYTTDQRVSNNTVFINNRDFYRKRHRFTNNPHYRRSNIQHSDESDVGDLEGRDLDTLESRKSNLLQQLDLNLALISASELREAELLAELKECRRIRSTSDATKWRIDRQLERIERNISVKMESEMKNLRDRQGHNFLRKLIAGMYRDTYCRSLRSRFPGSKLQKMYSEALGFGIDGVMKKIDPSIPLCYEELSDGRCGYAEDESKAGGCGCPFQHLN